MARNDYVTPAQSAVGAVIALVVAAFIGTILWKGFWFLDQAGTNDQYKVDRGSTSYQSSVVSQERDYVKAYDIDAKALATNQDPAFQSATSAQQSDTKSQFCTQYAVLNPAPQDLVLAHSRICP